MIKKLTYFIFIFIAFSANLTVAKPYNAALEYNKYNPYTYAHCDIKKIIKKANVNMLLWEKSLTDFDKKLYLEVAMRNYYLATKIDGSLIDAHLGLARAYDAMNIDRRAKEYFYNALNLQNLNPKTNYYFGNFYYKREDYLKALEYYKISYQNGYAKNFDLNYKLGIIYEKIADIQAAKTYYVRALKLKPSDITLNEKVKTLDDLNYESSQYYLFKKISK